MSAIRLAAIGCLWPAIAFSVTAPAAAATLTVEIEGAQQVTLVGALERWDQDGNHRRPPDPKAKIDAPDVDHRAQPAGDGRWVFHDLPAGTYDLVILAQPRLRVEGFTFVPVLEFDPFFPPDATTDAETRQFIVNHIKQSRHFENKVEPLYLGGDKQAVRVLVMLIRDQPTSYTPGLGTIRHEVWQYTWRYGGWEKEKRTKVLDRVLLPVAELRQWTWLWEPKLGGVKVGAEPVSIRYTLPQPDGPRELEGLYPY